MKKKVLSMMLAVVLSGTTLVSLSTEAYGKSPTVNNSSITNNAGLSHDKKVSLPNIDENLKAPSLFTGNINKTGEIRHESKNPKEIVNIPDENLKNALKDRLGLHGNIDITAEEMSRLPGYLDLKGLNIGNIEGLQYAINTDTIILNFNKISDITPLSSIKELKQLALFDNEISDISQLGDMHQLTFLDIGENPINNYDLTALSELKNLETLQFSGTDIDDISPLRNLVNLQELRMFNCKVKDLTPISSLHKLIDLYVPNNQITDISPLMDLKNLQILQLDFNYVSDIDTLKNLPHLAIISMSNNAIYDIRSLGGLDLFYLRVSGNDISDVSFLSRINTLENLYLDNNKISDISSLEHLNINGFSAKEQQINLDNSSVGEGTKIYIRDINGSIPNIEFLSNGVYKDNILTWSQAGANELWFSSMNGLFTGTISQIVL